MLDTYTITDYIEINGVDFECKIEYTYRPGDPGKTHGRPEDCYPPEDLEIEIQSLKIFTGKLVSNKTEKVFYDADFLLSDSSFYDSLEASIWNIQ